MESGEKVEGQIYLNQIGELTLEEEFLGIDPTIIYFHPLDLVHLILFDKDGKPMKPILVPAMHVKALASDIQVEELTFVLRLVGDIIIMMISVITLYGTTATPGIFLRVLSYCDLFLGGTDIGVLSAKKSLEQSELGRQFYALWDEIYLYGGFATATPLIMQSFYKLGLAAIGGLPIYSLERLAIMDEIIRATTERNTFLLKFDLEIIEVASKAAIITGNPYNIGPITRLIEADLLFLKGAHVETAAEEFFAIYKGEIIAQGTAKEVGKTLKKAMNATGKAKVLGALDKIWNLIPKLTEDSKFWTCFNEAGTELRWVNQLPGNPSGTKIHNLIIDALKSKKKPAVNFEGRVANEVSHYEELTNFRNQIENLTLKEIAGDIDTGTNTYFFEAKNTMSLNTLEEYGKKTIVQIDKYINPKNPLYINIQNKKVVLVIGELKDGLTLEHKVFKDLPKDVIIIVGINNIKKLY